MAAALTPVPPVTNEVAAAPPPSRRRLILSILAVVVVLGGGVIYLLEHGRESTDDAQVDAEVVAVPALLSGIVTKLHFVENQRVAAGELLAEIDAASAKARLREAEASLAQIMEQADAADAEAALAERNAVGNRSAARATLAGASVGEKTSTEQLREGEAQLASAQASYMQAQQDRERARALSASGAASKAELDRAENQYRLQESALSLANARLETLRSSVSAARSRIDEASARAVAANDVSTSVKLARAKAGAAHAQVDFARAQRDLATLDVSYTKIVAPQAGIVSKKAINVGQQVAVGQAIVQLVTDGRWVTANYKETQVNAMRVGQPATVKIDAFSGHKLRGELESLSGATGSRFALLPPDNASGNFTKVVQRVPVRVRLINVPTTIALRPGMNVELTIDTPDQVAMAAITTTLPVAQARVVNKWAVAVAVSLGALLEVINTSIVNVALTDMQNAFGATLTQVSWVVSSYAIANVIILPLTSWLGMRFGKKKYFTFSLIGFTAASALCGLAQNLPMLIIARVLQGLMGGGLLAKAQSILFETFPKEEQATAQGFFAAIVIAGPTIGPTLGGWLTTNVDWRWIFYINLPVGVAAVLMTLSALPEDEGKLDKSSVDWTALAMLAIGLGCLQTMLEEGQADLWFESPFILFMTIVAAVGLVSFVFRQLKSDRPVVDLRVLRYRSLWSGSILSIVVGIALYGAIFAVPVFAQSQLHFTSQQTGMLLLPGALSAAVTMPIVSILIKKYDPRYVLVVGGLILTAAMLMLGRLSPLTGADDLFWPLIVRSFGTVMMFLPLSLAALGPIPKKDIASASGFYNLTRQLGGSVGVAALSTILERREAFHRSVLVEKLGSINPSTLERVHAYAAKFLSMGMTGFDANQRALKLLDSAVNTQAQVSSFGDTFWITSVLVIVTLPLVFLLGKPQSGIKVDAH